MILNQDENISTITQDKLSVVELVKKLDGELYSKLKNDNIIVVITSNKGVSGTDVIEFLAISKKHRNAKHSFVIVTDKVDLDAVPDDIILVPTLQEARDIIEMEVMERDLGF